jgi:trigger factor
MLTKWWHEVDHDHDEDFDEDEDADDEAEDDESDEDDELAYEAEDDESDEDLVLDDDFDDDFEDDDDEDDDDDSHGHEHVLIDDEHTKIVLRESGDERDIFPGFSEQVLGMRNGEEKEFFLTLPDDFQDESLRGQTIEVEVEVEHVRSRTLPDLNDTFAAGATSGKFSTLLELRMDVRKNLEETARKNAEAKLFDEIMKQVVEQAEIQYHDATVETYVDRIVQNVDANLRRQMNLGLQDYLRLTSQNEADFRSQYQEAAVDSIKRDYVMMKLFEAENIHVNQDEIAAEVERVVEQFGEQSAKFRRLIDTEIGRREIAERQLNDKMVKRIVAIALGEEPSIEVPVEESPSIEASTEEAAEVEAPETK